MDRYKQSSGVSEEEGRNLTAPAIADYLSRGVVDNAFNHFAHSVARTLQTVAQTVIEEALLQAAIEVSLKIDQVEGLIYNHPPFANLVATCGSQ